MFDEVIIIIIIIIIVFIMAFTFSPQTMVAVLESLLVRMEQYANNLEVVIIFVLVIIIITVLSSLYGRVCTKP